MHPLILQMKGRVIDLPLKEEIKSMFQMTSFSIYNASFEIKRVPPKGNPLHSHLRLNVTLPNDVSETKGAVDLHIDLKLKSGKVTFISTKLSIKGNFAGKNMNKQQFIEFMKFSGVSNLTQIARSYIISMTSQLGIMPPIVLPMINLVEFYKKQERK